MIDRRTLLKLGIAAPAALGLPTAALAAGAVPGIDLLIVDRRHLPAEALGSSSVPVHVIDGDVTELWYHTLDLRWRQPGFVVAGYTGRDALFVLEQLARDRGRRVVQRAAVPSSAVGAAPLVRWIIAPVHPSVTGR